ncbi:hypothetical protein [Actinoplanes rectilineatus]|uniref:hypothetical protein n=1 Tax=Actinoplanes rectilineatus TaxID=113571 RepID=UPI0005F2C6AD|nr:hypothetical protein [Actinoplanes rectilineatus]
MNLTDALDLLERLLNAAGHPDIASVKRYGQGTEQSPAGIDLADQRGAHMYLFGEQRKGEIPIDVPTVLPTPKYGSQRVAVLAAQLLDAARPDALREWRLVAFGDLGPTDARGVAPAGISMLAADGSRILLRSAMGASKDTTAPDSEPSPGWTPPADLA